MQCPYCNSEMEKGIINQDRYPLKWKSEGPNAKKIKLTSFLEKHMWKLICVITAIS